MKRFRNFFLTWLITLGLGALEPSGPAFGQGLFSFTLAPNTVVGNARALAGPGQAIPFSTLTSKLLVAINGDCVASQAGVITCTINDTTTLPGVPATKYNPLFFGNTGTGRITRLNRLLCGEAALSSGDVGPVTTKDWLETLLANTTANAQFVCVDAIGELGVLGASRASDFRTAFASSTGGAQGVTGLGYNDDTVGAAIAVGMNAIGVRKSGAVGITAGYQADMNNAGSVVDIDPSATGVPNGATIAGLFTPGAYSGLSTANTTGALVVALGRTGGPTHRKGLIIESNALDTSVGIAGGGLAIDLFRNQTIRWRNSTPTTDAEMWGAANGINFNNSISVGVAGSTAGGIFINGAGGGTITAQPQFAAGTYNWNWPTTAGSAGQVLNSQAGGSNAMTWTSMRQMIGLASQGSVLPQASTGFMTSGGICTAATCTNGAELAVQMTTPMSGSFKNLAVVVGNAPASGQTVTATWRIGGANSAITCTITGPATSCSDTTHTATIAFGVAYDLQVVTSATTGTINNISGGIEFDNP